MAMNEAEIRKAAEDALTYGIGMLRVKAVDPYKSRWNQCHPQWFCRVGFHLWETHQHNFRAVDTACTEVVIAWKQCPRCGASKLIHILR